MSESSEPDILFNGAEWFEENKGKLINSALLIIVVLAGWQLYKKNVSETKAVSESALFSVLNLETTNRVDIAEAYDKVSADQEGKPVAERALILGAKTWLEVSNYEKALPGFEKYLANYSSGLWASEASLGQAICKEATGDVAAAINIYQSLTNSLDTAIQSRAKKLLEAAKVQLEPLASKPPVTVPSPAQTVEPPQQQAPSPAVTVPEQK